MTKTREKKWTKGPYQRDDLTVYALNHMGTNRFSAHVQTERKDYAHRTDHEEGLANARLFAASPDLVDALEMAVQAISDAMPNYHSGVMDVAIQMAQAALAKAYGEAASCSGSITGHGVGLPCKAVKGKCVNCGETE